MRQLTVRSNRPFPTKEKIQLFLEFLHDERLARQWAMDDVEREISKRLKNAEKK